MVETIKKEKRTKILVTGSSGMLGADVCGELSGEYDVVGLDINEPASGVSQPTVLCDITDRQKTIESIDDVKPDLIVHAAACTDVDGCEMDPRRAERINKDGTENIAAAASKLDIPLLYISTDFVFDGKKRQAYKEEDPANPINVYGRTKLEGEKAVSPLKRHMILRTSWMYGGNGKNFVDTITTMAKAKNELKVVNDQVGSPTYTKDLAKAIGRLLKIIYGPRAGGRGPGWGIYCISNKGPVSWFDYAKEILSILDIDNVKVIPIKSEQLDRPARRPAYRSEE